MRKIENTSENLKISELIVTVPSYAKQSGMTEAQVRALCQQGALPAFRTDGGQWRIKVNTGGVPREVYEEALKEIATLRAKFESLKLIVDSI